MVLDTPALRAALLVEGIELGEAIGAGRSGTVFGARWRRREVAVKVLDGPGPVVSPPAHAAILTVLRTGTALGRPFQVVERYPTDLARWLDGRPLRRDLWRPVLLPLLDALEHAHGRGVVHGDLKPHNVLVDPAARPCRVVLADFGAAPAPGPGLVASLASGDERELRQGVATLPYLAPERRAGGRPTAAADVYALGVLLFEVATGRLPAGLELPSELVAGLDPRIDRLVKAALARDPAARPAVTALRRELLGLDPGATASPPGEAAPAEMVRIPAGYLVIGDRDDPAARPMHEVHLPAFWIDRRPVTHGDYRAFVQATGAARPPDWPARGPVPRRLLDLPVTGVSWEEARAYAAWAGKRLPDEREWERAAQGPEQRPYPYGEAFDPARIAADPRRLEPVGSHPEGDSSEGVSDLTGNGWEWTASPFGPYDGPHDERTRVVRGGYDPALPRSGSATCRLGLRCDVRDPLVGFRCARDDGAQAGQPGRTAPPRAPRAQRK